MFDQVVKLDSSVYNISYMGKSATITKLLHCWQIKYDYNGQRKNCDNYQACIDHLKKIWGDK